MTCTATTKDTWNTVHYCALPEHPSTEVHVTKYGLIWTEHGFVPMRVPVAAVRYTGDNTAEIGRVLVDSTDGLGVLLLSDGLDFAPIRIDSRGKRMDAPHQAYPGQWVTVWSDGAIEVWDSDKWAASWMSPGVRELAVAL